MKKTAALGVSVLVLSGCALPVPLQVASWALDGLSMLATQKSVTDHGISILAQKDCAVWRGVVEGELCRDATVDVLIADAALEPEKSNAFAESEISEDSIEELANFETAAGAPDEPVEAETLQPVASFSEPAPSPAFSIPPVTTTLDEGVAVRAVPAKELRATAAREQVSKQQLSTTVAEVAPKARIVANQPAPQPKIRIAIATSSQPEAGIYYVIGSFRNHGNARNLKGRYPNLTPSVLAAKLDGGPIYRVVVGPVGNGHEKVVHKTIRRSGIADVWAIRVHPEDWMIAEKEEIASAPTEIARALK